MKRWSAPMLIVLLACAWVVLHRSSSPGQFQDTDTRVLLTKLQERGDPWSWFTGDWPLENHFYRPISTLAFELDRMLYPGWSSADPAEVARAAAGFGLTSALICALCVIALFWLVRELAQNSALAAGCAALFASWNAGFEPFGGWPILGYAVLGVSVIGLWRHGLAVRRWLPAALVVAHLPLALMGIHAFMAATPFNSSILGWLPARTATTMTLFALLAAASYARYERLGASRREQPAGPLDPPATRSSEQATDRTRPAWPWALLAGAFAALALGCYEQAVMLPAVLLGVAVLLRMRGYRVRWGWHGLFWSVLFGYMALRVALVPQDVSGYQAQQLRAGLGVYLSLIAYLLPEASELLTWSAGLGAGILVLFIADTYKVPFLLAANLAAFWQAQRKLVLALAGWGLSFLAFLPMAWVKQFAHYHYWPTALRSMLSVALVLVAWELLIIAASRPALQAPPRRAPAPGSLPRP